MTSKILVKMSGKRKLTFEEFAKNNGNRQSSNSSTLTYLSSKYQKLFITIYIGCSVEPNTYTSQKPVKKNIPSQLLK